MSAVVGTSIEQCKHDGILFCGARARHLYATVDAAKVRVVKSSNAAQTCGYESLSCSSVSEAVALSTLAGIQVEIVDARVLASKTASPERGGNRSGYNNFRIPPDMRNKHAYIDLHGVPECAHGNGTDVGRC